MSLKLNFILNLLILSTVIISISALILEDPRELFDFCLDARNHKSKPGAEDSLHHQCKPWANRSCCTSVTSVNLHYGKMYNFEIDHCKQVQPMSEKCKRHFVQDHCFYECSPNIGPWVVRVDQKIRNQRFVHVPLCSNDCHAWFEDCLEDYTCTTNWGRNFDWDKGYNTCPRGSSCKTFRETFKTAQFFCENVWDHSWKYTNEEEPCFRIWFDGSKPNPNEAVTKLKIDQILKENGYWKYNQKDSLVEINSAVTFKNFGIFSIIISCLLAKLNL